MYKSLFFKFKLGGSGYREIRLNNYQSCNEFPRVKNLMKQMSTVLNEYKNIRTL